MSRVGHILRNRWVGAMLVLLVVVVAATLAIVLSVPNPNIAADLAMRKPDMARGQYIAVLGDCTSCHTAEGGKPFAGGMPFPTPVGKVYSSNITPNMEAGIGKYSLKDFIRVMRFGVKADGTHLYPAMPYTSYSKVSDQDLQDLFAYLTHKIAPVSGATRGSAILRIFNLRWPVALWNFAFLDTRRFNADASKSADWNRGAYLVQGLEHCGACHTPRGLALEEKDVDGRTNIYLSGAALDGVSPINLRSNDGDGIGRWKVSDISELLKTGRTSHSSATGTMIEVVANSTQYLSDRDAADIATYLKSLSPAANDGRATFTPNDMTARAFYTGAEQARGGQMFMDSCAACHRLSGTGETLTFPDLAGNPSALSKDPSSLIAVILGGSRLPSTAGAPSDLAMPAFGWRYDDEDIAALATFIRSSWGNHASAVQSSQVTTLRRQIETAKPD
jgi:mono/diheme cytochrome c family protein